ncbi:cytidylate kinase-like family protein [bacterium]|nr:cytidylate kinase-like family protein [bacterium]
MEVHEHLVGRQMRRWEIDQRLHQRFERDTVIHGAGRDVITISRQWGSGGTNVASLVARELDFRFYDKELIDHVAETAGIDVAHVRQHDEHSPDVVSNLLLQLLEGHRPTETTYLRTLVKVMKQISKQGKAVIVGRAATCILQDSFRVRILAPEALRVARIAELHDMDLKTARRKVLESDHERYQFVRGRFGCDPSNPMGYDLVINTEHFTIEQAADIVIRAFRSREESGDK